MRRSDESPLKEEVRNFWNADPCGTRYMGDGADFDAHARARYQLEPYIHEFAGFAQSRGKRVLEVGVGMGADYLEWLKAGAQATGVDLSAISLERARQRCERAGYTSDLQVSDAEHLLFRRTLLTSCTHTVLCITVPTRLNVSAKRGEFSNPVARCAS